MNDTKSAIRVVLHHRVQSHKINYAKLVFNCCFLRSIILFWMISSISRVLWFRTDCGSCWNSCGFNSRPNVTTWKEKTRTSKVIQSIGDNITWLSYYIINNLISRGSFFKNGRPPSVFSSFAILHILSTFFANLQSNIRIGSKLCPLVHSGRFVKIFKRGSSTCQKLWSVI